MTTIQDNKIDLVLFFSFILFRILGFDTFEAATITLLFGIYWKL